MNILTFLPTDAFVAASFAELLEDVTNLFTAADTQKPRDTEEVAFWRRQLNALNKAESYLSLYLQRPHSICCVAFVIILIIVPQVLKRLAGLLVGTP